MADKKLNSSGGYFNKEMLAILERGEKKASSSAKKTASKGTAKKPSTKKK